MRWCTFDPKQAATATTSTKMFFENTKSSASIFKTPLFRGGGPKAHKLGNFDMSPIGVDLMRISLSVT